MTLVVWVATLHLFMPFSAGDWVSYHVRMCRTAHTDNRVSIENGPQTVVVRCLRNSEKTEA